MKLITLAFTIFALNLRCLRADSETYSAGPVSSVIQQLAYNTATINDEISLQLNANIDRTSNLIIGDVEVVVSSALDQLADPIFEANKQLQGSKCQQSWNMDELVQRINQQLTACSKELTDILDIFRKDASAIATIVQSSVDDIAKLPLACQSTGDNVLINPLENTFAGQSFCFVERIADINRKLSIELGRASIIFMRVRQQSKKSVETTRKCTQGVVDQTLKYLSNAIQACL